MQSNYQPEIHLPPSRDPLRREYDDGDRQTRLFRMGAVVLGLAGVLAFGAVIYSAFSPGATGTEAALPVIVAESSPMREAPLEPGGMVVPNRDSTVYDMISGNPNPTGMETLVPPPEAPVSLPQPVIGEAGPPLEGLPAPRRPDGQLALTAEEIRLYHQQKIEVLTDGGDAAGRAMNELSSNAKAPTVGASNESLMALVAPPLAPEPMVTPIVPTMEAPKVATRQSIKDAEAQVAKKLDKIAPAAGPANRFVQLGSVKSEAAAKAGWAKLQKAHPGQLGDLSASIRKVDLGAKGEFWRMRGGPVSEAEAKRICASLKSRGQDCIVAK